MNKGDLRMKLFLTLVNGPQMNDYQIQRELNLSCGIEELKNTLESMVDDGLLVYECGFYRANISKISGKIEPMESTRPDGEGVPGMVGLRWDTEPANVRLKLIVLDSLRGLVADDLADVLGMIACDYREGLMSDRESE